MPKGTALLPDPGSMTAHDAFLLAGFLAAFKNRSRVQVGTRGPYPSRFATQLLNPLDLLLVQLPRCVLMDGYRPKHKRSIVLAEPGGLVL